MGSLRETMTDNVDRQHALLKSKLIEAGEKIRNKLAEIIQEQENEKLRASEHRQSDEYDIPPSVQSSETDYDHLDYSSSVSIVGDKNYYKAYNYLPKDRDLQHESKENYHSLDYDSVHPDIVDSRSVLVSLSETFLRTKQLTRNLSSIQYKQHIWSFRENIIWFLRKNKIDLLLEMLIEIINIFLTNKIIEIVFVTLILIIYIRTFLTTGYNDDIVYFSNEYH